ncbi:MAG TPA: hypothetical protein ENN41_09390 [Sediminispirochaeta sp.]|nr:hypothetical protein [Sediminispirochaeta sp.]
MNKIKQHYIAFLWLAAGLAFFFPAALNAQQGEVLVLNTADTPPYSTEQDDGLCDLVLEEAFSRLGYQIEIRHLPSRRSIGNADMGIADGEYARIDSMREDYPNLRQVDEALLEYRFSVFSRSRVLPIEKWEDLAPYRVAFIHGWLILEQNVREAVSIITVPTRRRSSTC